MTFDSLSPGFIRFLQNNKTSNKIIYNNFKRRAINELNYILSFISKNDKILDIGAGTCNHSEILINKGFDVTGLDVLNMSFVKEITPIIFDGNKIPFKKDSFDVALLVGVLHHTENPKKMLFEAKRVSKRIIINEDIYRNNFEKHTTFIKDSFVNFQFKNHPHNNKTDSLWKELFKQLKLDLIYSKYKKSKPFGFNHAIYVVEK